MVDFYGHLDQVLTAYLSPCLFVKTALTAQTKASPKSSTGAKSSEIGVALTPVRAKTSSSVISRPSSPFKKGNKYQVVI
jgi:hypothetical protein